MTETLQNERLRNEQLRNRLLQARMQQATGGAAAPAQPQAPPPTAEQPQELTGLAASRERVRRGGAEVQARTPQGTRLDPEAAAVAGGLAGGVLAAPFALATGPAAPIVEIGGVALGASAARATANVLNELFFGAEDKRGFGERATETAVDIATEGAFGAAGATGGRAIRGIGAAAQRLVRPTGNAGTDTFNAFQRLRVQQSPGAVSQRPLVQGTEQTLAKLPFSAGITGDALRNSLDDLGRAHGSIADDIFARTLTKQEAGATLEGGLKTFVDRFTKVEAPKLYKRLNAFFRPEENIRLTNSIQQMAEPGTLFTELPEIKKSLVPAELQGWLTALERNKNSLTWKQVQALRSYVGTQAAGAGLVSDIPRGQWKRLYGALTADMRDALALKGPKAVVAFDETNLLYAKRMARIDAFLDRLTDNPEVSRSFDLAFSGSKGGDKALLAIKKSLKQDEWRALVATKFREMGLSTPGSSADLSVGADIVEGQLRTFSPKQYLTQWKALSPEARKVMFGDMPGDVIGALDDLVKVSSDVEKTAAFRNPSGTGPFNIYAAMLQGAGISGGVAAGAATGSVATGIGLAALPVALPSAVAMAFKNEKVIRWLAEGVRIAPRDFNGLAAHLGRLASIAADAQPEVRESIVQLARGLERAYKAQAANLRLAPEQRSRLPGRT